MKKILPCLACLTACFLASPVLAEPMTISVDQALNMMNALNLLDNHEQSKRNQLSGTVRLAAARDIRKLRAVVESFQEARKGKIAELAGEGGEIKPGSDAEKKLGKALTEMLAQKETVELTRLSVADLGILPPTSNPIPPEVIEGLGVLLDDQTEAGQASK